MRQRKWYLKHNKKQGHFDQSALLYSTPPSYNDVTIILEPYNLWKKLQTHLSTFSFAWYRPTSTQYNIQKQMNTYQVVINLSTHSATITTRKLENKSVRDTSKSTFATINFPSTFLFASNRSKKKCPKKRSLTMDQFLTTSCHYLSGTTNVTWVTK